MDFTSQLVLDPYAIPRIRERSLSASKQEFQSCDTFKTLFITKKNYEHVLTRQNVMSELEKHLVQMESLQYNQIQYSEKINIHNGSISLFLRYLVDPHIPLNALTPIPSFDTLNFQELLNHCFDMKIPPDRTCWAIKQFAAQENIDSFIVTRIFQKFWNHEKDPEYFVNLSYALYSKNLLQNPFLRLY